MEKQIASIQKKIFDLSQYTREIHVEEWKIAIKESKQIFVVVRNLSQQLEYLNQANLYEMPDFEELQSSIMGTILKLMNNEFRKLLEFIDRLSKSNQEVKNKLEALFRSTIDLDWTQKHTVINGTAKQPELSLILSEGMKYWKFYNNICSNIKSTIKYFNPNHETSMKNYFDCYNINDRDVPRFAFSVRNVAVEVPKRFQLPN